MRASLMLVSCAGLGLAAACGVGPISDSGPPQVAIVSPLNGATVSRNVMIEVVASDETGIDNVRILVDGTQLAKLLSGPYQVTWSTGGLPDGSTHTITAEARDFSQNLTSVSVLVTLATAQGAP